jgi:hypothetical protein
MKGISIVSIVLLIPGAHAFSVVPRLTTPPSPPRAQLAYECEDLHDMLHEEWRQLHGPRFVRAQGISSSTTASLVDESLAIHFPAPTVSTAASPFVALQAAPTMEGGGSYQGLSNPSKDGLVLAIAMILGMTAASPEVDISSIIDFPSIVISGDASALLEAGLMTLGRVMQDAHIGWVQLSSNLAEVQSMWMQIALFKLVVLKESVAVNAHALYATASDVANAHLQDVQRVWLAFMQGSKDSATALAQASQTTWRDTTKHLSELRSESMQDVQVWNLALMSNVEASKESMLEAMQNVESSWTDTTTRLSNSQNSWMQDAQVLSQAVIGKLDIWKDSPAVGVEEAQASWADTSELLSSKVRHVKMLGMNEEIMQTMEASKEYVVGRWMEGMQNVDELKNSVTLSMEGVQTTWAENSNRMSNVIHDLRLHEDEREATIERLAASKEYFVSRLSGWIDGIQKVS